MLGQAICMLFGNLPLCEGNVTEYYVSEEGERELAKEFLAKVRVEWFQMYGSRISTMGPPILGWKDFCLAHKDEYLELADRVYKFEQKYCEDNPKQPLTNTKMDKRACNGYHATFTEMSSMFNYYATAEKDEYKTNNDCRNPGECEVHIPSIPVLLVPVNQ